VLAQRVQWRVTSAAWTQYVGARDNLRLALDRQVELKQVLADLEHANQQTVRLNEMLSAARAAVEDARRAKEEFVANVSHELRTPLNMIIGFSDMILESPDTYAERLPPALLADIAAIRRNSEHLSGLVDDVLALAEADVGQINLLMEPTALHTLAQESAEAVRVLIRQKGLKMHLDVPTTLPLVHCDRTRIRQVILNLLGNAARFTEEGYVAVRAWVKGDNVVVEVEDTGPGIEASRLARIFEPFWQGDPAIRRRYGGTGLGLAISKRFVEAHGGTIGIRSAPEQGTTVTFTMPIEQPVAVDSAQRWLSPHGEYVQRQGPSRALHQLETTSTLVVAERHPTLSHLLARHLSDMRIVSVDSLVEAGQVLDARGAVGVVMNRFQQPEESPLHLTELHATFDVPVLSCSLPSRDLAVQRLGVDDYMLKPIQHEQLRATLHTHVPDAHTILVADDDDEARQLFVRMLLHLDPSYVVLDAEDGWETLELMESRRPDVVLLDLIMPGMDGFQVLEQRERHAELAAIPVIVISARDLEEERVLRDGLTVTRRDGLSGRDLAAAVSAVTQALAPRFAVPEQPGTPDGS
jgi:signal transduction histidine kinase/CheY-like chemotaxis protein